jgi:hypothetical protein
LFGEVYGVSVCDFCFAEERELFFFVECAEWSDGATESFVELVEEPLLKSCLCCGGLVGCHREYLQCLSGWSFHVEPSFPHINCRSRLAHGLYQSAPILVLFAQRFGRNTAKRLLREWGQSERFSGSRLLDKIAANFMDYLPEAHHLFEMARMLDDEASRNWSCICHYWISGQQTIRRSSFSCILGWISAGTSPQFKTSP